MFIRFVVPLRDEYCRRATGVFQAAYALRDRGLFGADAADEFEALRRWFNARLPAPDRFARSRRRGAWPNAVCWFKDCAVEHLCRIRQLATLLDRHDLPTRALRTRRPGYVVYEDQYQVAAVPFRDTPG